MHFAFGRPFFGYSYYSPFWWYRSIWYDPVWYGPVWWYPSSCYWLWYDDPWYYDHYRYPRYVGVYVDLYPSSSYAVTYTSPNSYVYGPTEPQEEPGPDSSGQEYLDEAVGSFRAGDYKEAARLAQHATVETPQNGAVYLLLAQAQFAMGQYLPAAETLHRGMGMLPAEDWGLIAENYRDYYGSVGEYTKQLRALEKFTKGDPTAPFAPFLLGYHYGYLGYPPQAVRELEKAVELAQTDQVAEQLLEIFSGKLQPAAAAAPR